MNLNESEKNQVKLICSALQEWNFDDPSLTRSNVPGQKNNPTEIANALREYEEATGTRISKMPDDAYNNPRYLYHSSEGEPQRKMLGVELWFDGERGELSAEIEIEYEDGRPIAYLTDLLVP